jgi:hypothetical protein
LRHKTAMSTPTPPILATTKASAFHATLPIGGALGSCRYTLLRYKEA